MYEVQDIILESEYNVLMKLSEYYEKQMILESFTQEVDSAAAVKNENLVVRFINWCKQMLARIKNKFKKVPPATPVPAPLQTATQQVKNAVSKYNKAESIESSNPSGAEQLMQQAQQEANQPITVDTTNNTTPTSDTTQQTTQVTVAELQQAADEMEKAVANNEAVHKKLQQQTGRLNNVNDPEVKKLNTKIKTGSVIIKKITGIISRISNSIQDGLNINPTQQIEGEPSIDTKRYGSILKVKFSKAKDVNSVKNVYDASEVDVLKALNWYTDKQMDPSTLPKDKTYCLNKISELKELDKIIKHLYRERMIDLKGGGEQQQNQTNGG